MKKSIYLILILFCCNSFSQQISGNELLEKAIQFHDPNNYWPTFSGSFIVTMKTPKAKDRISTITIDLPNQFFSVQAKRGKNTSGYFVDKNKITLSYNGENNLSQEIKEKNGITEERAKLYKNYYTYLYGLPMKLKDNGTIINPKVELKKFKGKEYLVLKVTYPKEIGKDTWCFYFNPKTYAMEVYQFFKDTKDSGEYILLSGIEEINRIKMPKNRAWYYNKDNTYLGTDYLTQSN